MAIATGPAVVGRLTGGANLSVLGETTNLAARLQAQAGAGQILLAEDAWRRLREPAPAKRELLKLKGFDRRVVAYRIS
jgi:class 3 adenylate cyclase